MNDKDTVRRVLVTTSIESTIPENSPVLFLGEWCREINNNENQSNCRMLEDVFEQVKQDNVGYLDELSNRVLISLTSKLNEKQNVSHSVLFWKRVLGKWLDDFIHSQHLHWNLIKHIESSCLIEKTYIIQNSERYLQCKNNMMNEDVNLWLHASFAHIIINYTNIPYEYVNHKVSKKRKKASLSTKNKFLILLSKIFYKLKLINNKGVLFLNTSMSFFDQLKTEILCKQIPTSWLHNAYQFIEIDDNPHNKDMRNWSLSFSSSSDFERFLEEVIVYRLPRDVIENFEDIGYASRNLSFPAYPKNIFLGDWPKSRSILLRAISEKLEESPSTLLTLIQHGGNYGMDKYHSENFSLSISHRFLSWGWGEEINKVIPMFYHKKYYKPLKRNSKKRLTLISLDIKQMPIKYSSFSPSQYKKFLLKDLDQFFRNIDRPILNNSWLRGFKNHSGIYEYYSTIYPRLQIDRSFGIKGSVKSLIDSSKLFVVTYNTTLLQEIMLSNSPVVIFWSSELIPIEEEFKYCFEQMKHVGLFHDCPKSAALHINSIWDDIDSWWNSQDTISARKLFCKKFAKSPANYRKLAETLLK